MKIAKYILHSFFKLIDLVISDETLLKILLNSKNKLFRHFVLYKINLELEKQGPKYWLKRSAIFYFIYVKNFI